MSAKTRNANRNPSANGDNPDNRLTDVLNPGPETPDGWDATTAGTETPPANPSPSGVTGENNGQTATGDKPARNPDRNNFSPADVANLLAIGFASAGGSFYAPPDANGGFDAIERVVAGGRYYLIRYVKPAGCPIPKPLFRTPFEPVFYPR